MTLWALREHAQDCHLPPYSMDVLRDGEVICTIWNRHHRRECRERAEIFMNTMIANEKQFNNEPETAVQ